MKHIKVDLSKVTNRRVWKPSEMKSTPDMSVGEQFGFRLRQCNNGIIQRTQNQTYGELVFVHPKSIHVLGGLKSEYFPARHEFDSPILHLFCSWTSYTYVSRVVVTEEVDENMIVLKSRLNLDKELREWELKVKDEREAYESRDKSKDEKVHIPLSFDYPIKKEEDLYAVIELKD